MKNRILLLLCTLLLCVQAGAQGLSAEKRTEISDMLTRILDREVRGGKTRITRVVDAGNRLTLYASIGMSYYPFRPENVTAIYDSIRSLLPASLARRRLSLVTDKHPIEELIPRIYRSGSRSKGFTNEAARPLVTRFSSPVRPTRGLAGRHIAMWQSHGRYFDQQENRWKWQRSRLWETCEDLYTQSYVLPYLVPMLERAGANVLLPRERDTQCEETIADNDPGVDAGSSYAEYTGARRWFDAGEGFAHRRDIYTECQNPFAEGTARGVQTVTDGRESRAEWSVEIPASGEYAVYVSYKSMERSAEDALYTVRHLGGESRFAVNQTMGGGTWIYLGTFRFAAGRNPAVVALSNRSSKKNRIVTADAVRIGGGMGNIARTPAEEFRTSDTEYVCEPSGYPRFCEGSRYWLQWAGFPESVYRQKEGLDDYTEDYMSRAHWVNALMGGSERLPDEEGLRIPIDMALAFHSDAGTRRTDETIGTLGIFFTQENKGRFEGGASRYLSRDLTDMVMTQIVDDIRATYEPDWRRRGLWNRSYYEARVPAAPTMLLELLSHQNFADMRYGSDPRFKFLVSRAIYKAILRFVSFQYDRPCTVQPLPVRNFSAVFTDHDNEVRLRWRPTDDPLEKSAVPTGYVLYTRCGDGDFDNGRALNDTTAVVRLEPGVLYSFRVTATNAGGESFPGETLSAAYLPQPKGRVLVVNGFDRVSAPLSIQGDSIAGFYRRLDSGVADRYDISFIGEQRVFDRRLTESDNDEEALGSCYTDYATEVIGGNTFDYPRLHGESILKAGYSFCSTSAAALSAGDVDMEEYFFMDLILGKQRAVEMGRGTSGHAFQTFPQGLQRALRKFTASGRSLFVSGSFIATDPWLSSAATDSDRDFVRSVLHYAYRGGRASRRGEARVVPSAARMARERIYFNTEPCRDFYPVEAPDALAPVQEGFTVMRYDNGDQTAAVGYSGHYRSLAMGFPFEAIVDASQRDRLMAEIMKFLEPRK